LRAGYAEAGVDAELTPFIDDTAPAFAEADLVICRAGASTVTEIAAVGAPRCSFLSRLRSTITSETRHQAHPFRRHRRLRHERHRRDAAEPGLHDLGSDLATAPPCSGLAGLGIRPMWAMRRHVAGADAVVTSTAVKADNPEVIAARERAFRWCRAR
jgi:hypothetical protein